MFVACYVDGIAIVARKGAFVVTVKGETTVFRPGEGLRHNHTTVEFYAGRINIDSRSKTAVTTEVSVQVVSNIVDVATYTHSTKEWDNWADSVEFSNNDKSIVHVRINSKVTCLLRRICFGSGAVIFTRFCPRGTKTKLVF